jgi:hypothetical protein
VLITSAQIHPSVPVLKQYAFLPILVITFVNFYEPHPKDVNVSFVFKNKYSLLVVILNFHEVTSSS